MAGFRISGISQKFPVYAFLFVAFITGWVSMYGNVLVFLLIPLLAYNIYKDPQCFRASLKREKVYLLFPLVFLIYMGIHTLIITHIKDDSLKPSYGIFETVLMYFILIPLYILSIKKYLTPSVLKRALLLFAVGVTLFNVCVLFSLVKSCEFNSPTEILNYLYQYRFGENKTIFGGDIMLEPQSMVLALASLVAFYFAIKYQKFLYLVLFFLLTVLLSFTVTKIAILAWAIGVLFVGIFLFCKLNVREKSITLVVAVILIVGIVIALPKQIQERFEKSVSGIENIQQHGGFDDGSVGTRLAMWKIAKKNVNDFGLLGVGVYYKETIKVWYTASELSYVQNTPNVHNSFLEYWIKGGIPGLLLLILLFVAPVYRMFRNKKTSILIFGILILIFMTSNTCVLFVHNYSLKIILIFLSLSYFYSDTFNALEAERRGTVRSLPPDHASQNSQ